MGFLLRQVIFIKLVQIFFYLTVQSIKSILKLFTAKIGFFIIAGIDFGPVYSDEFSADKTP